ncbi:MAG TPA: hypothetical protein VMV48_12865 [Gallionellaceae bacterium]|nr:hypothetical protein [Gallionellaceae bacterium]
MMARKIIYVSWIPLTAKVLHDWHIDHLISKGGAVEYWDVTRLLRGELLQIGAISTDYTKYFQTYREVEEQLKLQGNSDSLFVMLVGYDGRRASFYRLFTKYDCRMVFINLGTMPILTQKNIVQKSLLRLNRPLTLAEDIYFKIKGIVFRKLKLIKPYDIYFSSGELLASETSIGNSYARKEVPINSSDYENHMKECAKIGCLVEGAYAVYLDIYLPFQSDLEVCGMQAVTPSLYYSSLNRFFRIIEAQCNLKVVIAAHPKADYHKDTFEGREIFSGQTPRLVKNAEFVIVEASTSISYAVLNYKPIVSIYTEEMSHLYRDNFMLSIYAASSVLGSSLYNIDTVTQNEKINIRDVDQEKYDRYKYSYLTSKQSEKRNSSDIFYSEMTAW